MLDTQQEDEGISQLRKFIRSNPDPRELKRALAVKMSLQNKAYTEISQLLEINKSVISYWKKRFIEQGIDGIKLGYQGNKSFLTSQEREEIVQWLKAKNYWSLEDLVTHIEVGYGVVYQSKQSYYDLFTEAEISWKKSQKVNPKADAEEVKKKREEIQEYIQTHQAEIVSGELVILFLDECHVCWGDICGYTWGRTDMRIEIPILNQRERQTYYGALNYETQEFMVQSYETGNGENTVDFMKYIQKQYPNKRIVFIWDGAAYHQSKPIKDFLTRENQGKERAEWACTCIQLAPHAPEQNPVEDVWLQGKNFLRSIWHLLKNFEAVKYLFELRLNHQRFYFLKIAAYSPRSNLY